MSVPRFRGTGLLWTQHTERKEVDDGCCAVGCVFAYNRKTLNAEKLNAVLALMCQTVNSKLWILKIVPGWAGLIPFCSSSVHPIAKQHTIQSISSDFFYMLLSICVLLPFLCVHTLRCFLCRAPLDSKQLSLSFCLHMELIWLPGLELPVR